LTAGRTAAGRPVTMQTAQLCAQMPVIGLWSAQKSRADAAPDIAVVPPVDAVVVPVESARYPCRSQ
jgi:hypothetical protein